MNKYFRTLGPAAAIPAAIAAALLALPTAWSKDPTPTPTTSGEETFMRHHRVPEDDLRDELRRPNLLMKVIDPRPGARVLDIGAGDGYTSMYLQRQVGATGTIYAQNPPEWRSFLAPYLAARLESGPLPGVQWVERPFDDPVPPEAKKLDLVTNVLTYHDLLYMKVDRQLMNRRIFDALRPGGRYVIVDHHARPEDGKKVGHTLHRIARDSVRAEVEDAGFVLVANSDILRDPSDDRTSLAWTKPQVRTDRFVLVFERPAKATSGGATTEPHHCD